MTSAYPSTDAQIELQKLLFDTLRLDAGIIALSDGVYDAVPPKPWGAKQGYISFGAADVINEDAECLIESTHTVQIDCWSRQVGSVHAKRMVDAVYAVLHENSSLALSVNALVQTQVILRQVFRDPDGLTTHGVLQVQAQIEERSETSGPAVGSAGLASAGSSLGSFASAALITGAFASAGVASAAFSGPATTRIVATNGKLPTGVQTPGAKNGFNGRWHFFIGRDCTTMQACFDHWYVEGTTTFGTDIDGVGNLTITKVAIESVSLGVSKPVLFATLRNATIAPGGTLMSDALNASDFGLAKFTRGEKYYCRVLGQVVVTTGTLMQVLGVGGSGDSHAIFDPATQVDSTDLTGALPAQAGETATPANSYGYGPTAIIGQCSNSTDQSYIAFGDSITDNNNDPTISESGPAWFARSSYPSSGNAYVPCLNLAKGSARARYYSANLAKKSRYFGFADRAVDMLGSNDIFHESRTATQIYTDCKTIWTSMKAANPNIKIIKPTLVPRTTSSDGWTTVSGQGYPAGFGPGATQDTFRTMCIAGVGTDLYATYDFATPVDPTLVYKWKANVSSDGTHPDAPGHINMALEWRRMVLGIDQAPTDIALSATSINTGAAQGTVVGTLSTTDPDIIETFTYSLVDSAGGRFQIAGNQLQAGSVATNWSTATTHGITLRTTDAGGLSFDEAFTISVINTAAMVNIDFVAASYAVNGATSSSYATAISSGKITFARALDKWIKDSTGLLTNVGSGTLGVSNLGACIEPAATNLYLNSRSITGGTWSRSGASGTANNQTGPDNTANSADTLTASGAATHYTRAATPVTAGISYCVSWYTKSAGARDGLTFDTTGFSTGPFANWDNDGVTLLQQGGTLNYIQADPAVNGFARHALSAPADISASPSAYTYHAATGIIGRLPSYSSTAIYYVDFAQLEVSDPRGPTSPIVTVGSTVTRPADALVIAGITNGTYAFTMTFDDNSTQTLSGQVVSAGIWAVPTNLSRYYVKRIMSTP